MTQKRKGRTKNTLARLDEQQGAAASLRAECVKQLQRLADQAENLETSDFSGDWNACCEIIAELGKKASQAEKAYGEGLRDLLRDKEAMQEQVRKDWPAFDFQLHRLFPAIHKIYDSVADSLPPLSVRRVNGQIMPGRDALDRGIRKLMGGHRLKILGSRKASFHSFYDWQAKEVSARANIESESKLLTTRRRRGPEPDMDRHRAIAAAKKPFGVHWKKPENLEKIRKKLERMKKRVPLKAREKGSIGAQSWIDLSRERLIRTISYSLDVMRDSS
jgi:hypothetical protein